MPKGRNGSAYEPDRWSISGEHFVGCQENQSLRLSLGNKHPVKRISVVPGQIGDCLRLRASQWEALERLEGESGLEVSGETEFVQAHLQPDLPKADGGDKEGILWFAEEHASLVGE